MKMRYYREELELEIGDVTYICYNVDARADIQGYYSSNPYDYDIEITSLDFGAMGGDENGDEYEVTDEKELAMVEDYLTEWILENAEWID